MAGYTYKRNSFYIETNRDLRFNDVDFSNFLHGSTFSSKEAFKEAINLDHEINHYIQELFLYGCITEGFFRDYLAAYARELSCVKEVRFPLASRQNIEYNKSLNLERDATETLNDFYKTLDIYNFIYKQPHFKPQTEDYQYSDIADPIFSKYSIKYTHLLESYAYHKAYWDFFFRNQSGEGADLLHQLVEDNNVYPIKWRDGGYRIEDVKQNIKWNEPYQLVNLMTILGLNFGESNKLYLEYCEKEIPHHYMESPSSFYNSVQRLIYETALTIPSIGFILSTIMEHKYEKEVFSPVHRFYKIIKNIRDYGGYPDAVQGEDFFSTFFNWCAEQNGWPTYQETYDSIVSMLAERAYVSHEAITNYQLNAVYHKNIQYGKDAQNIPLEILATHFLPLMIRSKNRLLVLQMMNNAIFDVSLGKDFYQTMFETEKVTKYKPLTRDMGQDEIMEQAFLNGQASLREILYRLFSGAALNAYIYDGVFSCPLHRMGCPTVCDRCQEFKNFDNVFDNCQKKIFRFSTIKAYYPNGDGNIPDCMFFNYLLDYKYNILIIENGTV